MSYSLAIERQRWTSELDHAPWTEWALYLCDAETGNVLCRIEAAQNRAGLDLAIARWRRVGCPEPTRLPDRACVLRDPF